MRTIIIVLLAANSLLLMVCFPEAGYSLPQVEFLSFVTIDLSGLSLRKIFLAVGLGNGIMVTFLTFLEAIAVFKKVKKDEELAKS